MDSPASLTNQVAHLYYELEALVDANKLRAYTNRLRISENSLIAPYVAFSEGWKCANTRRDDNHRSFKPPKNGTKPVKLMKITLNERYSLYRVTPEIFIKFLRLIDIL